MLFHTFFRYDKLYEDSTAKAARKAAKTRELLAEEAAQCPFKPNRSKTSNKGGASSPATAAAASPASPKHSPKKDLSPNKAAAAAGARAKAAACGVPESSEPSPPKKKSSPKKKDATAAAAASADPDANLPAYERLTKKGKESLAKRNAMHQGSAFLSADHTFAPRLRKPSLDDAQARAGNPKKARNSGQGEQGPRSASSLSGSTHSDQV